MAGNSWVRLLLLLSALPFLAYGRLGEDPAACDLRYNPQGTNRQDLDKASSHLKLVSGPATSNQAYS